MHILNSFSDGHQLNFVSLLLLAVSDNESYIVLCIIFTSYVYPMLSDSSPTCVNVTHSGIQYHKWPLTWMDHQVWPSCTDDNYFGSWHILSSHGYFLILQFQRPTTSKYIRIYESGREDEYEIIDVLRSSYALYPSSNTDHSLRFFTRRYYTIGHIYNIRLDEGTAHCIHA